MIILVLILLALAIAGAAYVASRGAIGARAVGPLTPVRPAEIEFFDVQPRHICSGDTLTATWRARGDSGTLTAIIGAPVPPFLIVNLANAELASGSRDFAANVGMYGAVVNLHVSRPGSISVDSEIRIPSYDRPNAFVEVVIQAAFVESPRGWLARRSFSADLTPENDSWSRRIAITHMHYRAGAGRSITVIWNGTELATLSPALPDYGPLPDISIVGDWVFFVEAQPGEGPHSGEMMIHIDFKVRCSAP